MLVNKNKLCKAYKGKVMVLVFVDVREKKWDGF